MWVREAGQTQTREHRSQPIAVPWLWMTNGYPTTHAAPTPAVARAIRARTNPTRPSAGVAQAAGDPGGGRDDQLGDVAFRARDRESV